MKNIVPKMECQLILWFHNKIKYINEDIHGGALKFEHSYFIYYLELCKCCRDM